MRGGLQSAPRQHSPCSGDLLGRHTGHLTEGDRGRSQPPRQSRLVDGWASDVLSGVLGSKVDNILKFSSKHRMQRKNIESYIQNTKPPRIDDPII